MVLRLPVFYRSPMSENRTYYQEEHMNGRQMKTGTDAQVSGLYVSECCDLEASFVADQTFTRCMKCSNLTSWEILEADLRMAA